MTTNAAGPAIPCSDYPVKANVGHVNMNSNWWDTTTVPLPWANTSPPVTTNLPFVSGVQTIGFNSYPTQAQKAEVVLAILLNVLMGKQYVELTNRVVREERQEIEFVYQDLGLMIRVPTKMRFSEIVDALYEEFGNLRGKQIL